MTKAPTTADFAEQMQAVLPRMTDEDDRHLAGTLFNTLAEGRPVEIARLGEAVRRPETEVAAALAEPQFDPYLYRDDHGRVVGFGGLAVPDMGETPHRLSVDGRKLYAWCAWDALFLPVALDREATVESRCPATGARITLTVSPDGVSDLEPSGAVISFLRPEEIEASVGSDVIRSFCDFIHFFASNEAARGWISEHPDTFQAPIEDGFELGRVWVAHAFGVGAEAEA